jgi:hypothetical protein
VNGRGNPGWFTGVGSAVRTRANLSRLSLAVAPVLILGLFLSSRALLKCDADGVARAACCCAVDTHGGDRSPGAHVSERCCCDTMVVGPVASTSAVAVRAATSPTSWSPFAAVLSVQEPAPSIYLSRVEVTRSAWPPNVSLFVLKSALLI